LSSGEYDGDQSEVYIEADDEPRAPSLMTPSVMEPATPSSLSSPQQHHSSLLTLTGGIPYYMGTWRPTQRLSILASTSPDSGIPSSILGSLS